MGNLSHSGFHFLSEVEVIWTFWVGFDYMEVSSLCLKQKRKYFAEMQTWSHWLSTDDNLGIAF